MFGTDKSFLVKEANLQQEVFKNIAEPFIKHYKKLAIYERNNSYEQ